MRSYIPRRLIWASSRVQREGTPTDAECEHFEQTLPSTQREDKSAKKLLEKEPVANKSAALLALPSRENLTYKERNHHEVQLPQTLKCQAWEVHIK